MCPSQEENRYLVMTSTWASGTLKFFTRKPRVLVWGDLCLRLVGLSSSSPPTLYALEPQWLWDVKKHREQKDFLVVTGGP